MAIHSEGKRCGWAGKLHIFETIIIWDDYVMEHMGLNNQIMDNNMHSLNLSGILNFQQDFPRGGGRG